MSVPAAYKKRSIMGDILQLEGFQRLAGELQPWRKSDDLKILEAAKGSALVLPFVKGLRLSARLIYILRAQLSHTDLEVDWGHLLDKDGNSFSPECDVIIHRKGYLQEWNDSTQRVMHFKFIEAMRAIAVISCKSYADSVDADYVKKVGDYVKNILLFAECCDPNRIASLKQKAKTAGYVGFWHLYTYDKATGMCTNDPDSWSSFLQAVKSRIKRANKK
jgi:hypothetical protein